jgi:hypothetical protein
VVDPPQGSLKFSFSGAFSITAFKGKPLIFLTFLKCGSILDPGEVETVFDVVFL